MAINYQGGNDSVVVNQFGGLMKTLQNNYQAELAQKQEQRKQKDALMTQAQKEMSKVNSSGIRKIDTQGFDERYNKLKDIYFNITQSKDPSEQRKLWVDFNETLGDTTNYVSRSKSIVDSYNKSLDRLPTMVGKGRVDEYKNHLLKSNEIPLDQLNNEYFDSSKYLYTFDLNKADSDITKSIEAGFKNPEYVNRQVTAGGITNLSGGKRLQDVVTTAQLKDDAVFNILSNLYKTNTNVKGYVDDLVSSGQATDLNSAIMSVKDIYADKIGYVRDDVKQTNPDKADNSLAKSLSDMAKAIAKENEIKSTIKRNKRIAILHDANGDPIIGKDGKPKTWNADSGVAFNKTQSLSSVVSGFDPTTGKPVYIQSPKNAEIFGVFEKNGNTFMQVRYEQNGREKIMVSPDLSDINKGELSKSEREYLDGYREVIREEKTTPNSTSTTPKLQGGNIR